MRALQLLMATMLLFACEDVIELNTPSEEPRLIVDALVRVDESLPTTTAVVKVKLSSSFLESSPATELNQITIINFDQPADMAANVLFLGESSPGSGIYTGTKSTDFFTSGRLVFQLNHEGQLYLARTTYMSAAAIDTVMQGDDFLLDKDQTELIVKFQDDPEKNNYYLFDFGSGEFFGTKDTFYQGQSFEFSYFSDQNLTDGDRVSVTMMGADQEFYNYMQLLIEQDSDDLSLFDTPSATPRGNIFNVTELDNVDVLDNVDLPDNFALGYFAVVQATSNTITIQ